MTGVCVVTVAAFATSGATAVEVTATVNAVNANATTTNGTINVRRSVWWVMSGHRLSASIGWESIGCGINRSYWPDARGAIDRDRGNTRPTRRQG